MSSSSKVSVNVASFSVVLVVVFVFKGEMVIVVVGRADLSYEESFDQTFT